MTCNFSFSDKEDAKFPDACRAATLVWSDIFKTMMSDETGVGTVDEATGSVRIEYQTFEITLNADGSFSGFSSFSDKRKVSDVSQAD